MPDECATRVAHLNKLFHPDLIAAGVTFDLLSVATDGDGPALTLHGVEADAIVSTTNVKQRAKGAADVEIVFDEAKYLFMSDAEKDALVDHELEHVELKRDAKTNSVKLDCRGRPKIKMRPHDAEFGWFTSVAERHGEASGEIQQARKLFAIGEQIFFPFAAISSDRKRAALAQA